MGIRPQFQTVLDLPIRTYDYATYSTAYLAAGDTRLGNVSKAAGDGLWQTEAGFVGSRQECLEQLVRAYRISNPNQKQPAPPPMLDRKEFLVLDEKVWVHTFRLTPTLAVWTDSGQPIGVLLPEGEGWRRPADEEGFALEDCLEAMVRDYHAAQRGVTCV